MLTANFSQDSVAVMQKHAERCMDILEAKLDQDMFDIEDAIHQCMIDANKGLPQSPKTTYSGTWLILQSWSWEAREAANFMGTANMIEPWPSEFAQAFLHKFELGFFTCSMYNLGFTRLVKPYLQPEMIYNLTPYKRRQEDLIHAVKDFIKQVQGNSIAAFPFPSFSCRWSNSRRKEGPTRVLQVIFTR